MLNQQLNMKFKNFGKKEILEKMLNVEIRLELEENILNQIKPTKIKIYKWRRLNSFPLDFVHSNYRNLLPKTVFLKSGNGNAHSKVKIPRNFTKGLAYIMGALRDGSVYTSRGKHWIRIYDTSDAMWIKTVNKIFKQIFDTELHLRSQKKINAAYLDVSSKPLFHLFKILFNGKQIHKDVPEIIKTSPIEIKKAYIEGFFDAEGHVPHNNTKRYQIDFSQKDIKSLEFVKDVLENIGIKCGKISTNRLPIYGKDNIRKFYSTLNLLNLERSKRIRILIEAPQSGKATLGIVD